MNLCVHGQELLVPTLDLLDLHKMLNVTQCTQVGYNIVYAYCGSIEVGYVRFGSASAGVVNLRGCFVSYILTETLQQENACN